MPPPPTIVPPLRPRRSSMLVLRRPDSQRMSCILPTGSESSKDHAQSSAPHRMRAGHAAKVTLRA